MNKGLLHAYMHGRQSVACRWAQVPAAHEFEPWPADSVHLLEHVRFSSSNAQLNLHFQKWQLE